MKTKQFIFLFLMTICAIATCGLQKNNYAKAEFYKNNIRQVVLVEQDKFLDVYQEGESIPISPKKIDSALKKTIWSIQIDLKKEYVIAKIIKK